MFCKECQKEFKDRAGKIFCSKRCRKRVNLCKCGTRKWYDSIYCAKCYREQKKSNLTLEESLYYGSKRATIYCAVRQRARTVAKQLGWSSCYICGYGPNIQIAHIKPINTFPLSAPINLISDVTNIVPLCPNCHFEYDRGLLKLDFIKTISIIPLTY
jgi:predicted restriction endonuclease